MSSTNAKPGASIRQVNCPSCQRIVPWTEQSRYRPFCSRQCQLIDFGDWATERHAIPGEQALDESGEDSSAETPRARENEQD